MHGCTIKKLVYILFLCIVTENVFSTEKTPSPTMALENSACMECHIKQSGDIVKNWKNSAHAATKPVVNCISCHGKLHKDLASKARRDESCIRCHGGEKNPVVHSYSSSKHGTLMRLEESSYNWNKSFELANYRAPGCGYCHMHKNNHNVSTAVRHDLMNRLEIEMVQDKTRGVCQDCHSPRYITHLFSNGESMLEIGRKKVREANHLVDLAAKTFSNAELAPAKKQLEKMQQHLKNVYLGIGHQSPDYQWWYGQPALDGDLLRIKDSLGELRRTEK